VLRVLHVASHDINVGDGALNAVIRERVSALAGTPVDFRLVDISTDPLDLTAEDVDAFDLVIVGGGGSISNDARSARNGIALPMEPEEYARSKTRFAFVGLGHNMFAGDDCEFRDALTTLIGRAAERGDPFSVRNDGSLDRLRRDLGADVAATVHEVPDPGALFDAPPLPPETVRDRPYALIQLAGDRKGDRIGPHAEHQSRFIDAMAGHALRLWRDHGLDILIAPHIFLDARLSTALLTTLYARARPGGRDRPFRMGGTPHPMHARRFFGSYAAAELVIGMRGHAVICGVGLGRPVVALSTHPKLAGFMSACDLDPWTVVPSDALEAHLDRASGSLLGTGRAEYDSRREAATRDFGARLDALLMDALAR